MVRSEKLGYLSILNRRCVAQSRAKCGLYFIGNLKPFEAGRVNVWTPLLKKLKDSDCLGSEIVVQCPRHPMSTQIKVAGAKKLKEMTTDPATICKIKCDMPMPCNISDHNCALACSSINHNHTKCDVKMTIILAKCGHPMEKKCHEDENRLHCQVRVQYTDRRCGHELKRKCYVDQSKLTCTKECEFVYTCGHQCGKHTKNQCGQKHEHKYCEARDEQAVFPICKHQAPGKICGKPFSDYKCRTEVKVTLPKCSHEMMKKCSMEITEISCNHECGKTKPCGHVCKELCGKVHSHEVCEITIEAPYPKCNHVTKKRCSEIITWPCKKNVECKLPCGHEDVKTCSQPLNEVRCEKPCARQRKCGHPCNAKCGENCETRDCKPCLKKFRERAGRRAAELRAKVVENSKKKQRNFFLETLDSNSSEYLDIQDKVYGSNLTMHNWYKSVTKIDKITNYRLEEKYENAKLSAFGSHEAEKFHGTSKDGVKNIPIDGFRLPSQPGMYGSGIYFATNSSKSAQEIYTKQSNTLLLCKVLLGKELIQRSANNKLDQKELKKKGCDSVFAPRDSKEDGGEYFVNNLSVPHRHLMFLCYRCYE